MLKNIDTKLELMRCEHFVNNAAKINSSVIKLSMRRKFKKFILKLQNIGIK